MHQQTSPNALNEDLRSIMHHPMLSKVGSSRSAVLPLVRHRWVGSDTKHRKIYHIDCVLGATISVLYHLDGQSLHQWPIGLTVITVLSKVASAALILPISEAIGQLKWTWFDGKKARNVFDFEIFDKASRGAWGSVMLLCRTKGKSLAAFGAVLTLLLLAMDMFFQKVTDLPERWKLHGESLLPRSVRYTPDAEYTYDNSSDEVPIAQVNTDMKRAVAPFFYDQNGTHPLVTGNSSQAEIPISCPTSRCDWPPYDTLGVCSACEDISDLLDYACLTMSLDWIRSSTGPGTETTYPKGKSTPFLPRILAS